MQRSIHPYNIPVALRKIDTSKEAAHCLIGSYSVWPGAPLDLKGMADSKEFASEVFVALSRRRHINPDDGVLKEQLKEFWEEMTDQNFDSRLRIFFDM